MKQKSHKWFLEVNPEAKCFKQVLSILEEQNNAVYAFILHDKDIYEDGTPKLPHYHIYLKYKNARDFETIQNHFQGAHIEQANDEKSCIQYLTHKNDENKYQYNPEEVKTNEPNLLEYLKEQVFERFNPNNILTYFNEGATSIMLLYLRFGNAIQPHLRIIQALLKEYSQEDLILSTLQHLSTWQFDLLGQAKQSGLLTRERYIEIMNDKTRFYERGAMNNETNNQDF